MARENAKVPHKFLLMPVPATSIDAQTCSLKLRLMMFSFKLTRHFIQLPKWIRESSYACLDHTKKDLLGSAQFRNGIYQHENSYAGHNQ